MVGVLIYGFSKEGKMKRGKSGLDYFYNFFKFVASENASLRKIYQGVVDFIPSAWQYPEITCAKLIFDDREFSTENY